MRVATEFHSTARRMAKAALLEAASLRRIGPGLRVLNYHELPPVEIFREHLALVCSSVTVIGEAEVISCCEGRRSWPADSSEVLLTADDGYACNFTEPYLEAISSYRVRPLLFLIGIALDPAALSDHPHLEHDENGMPRPLVSPAALSDAIDAGWTVGAHTWTHRDPAKLNEQELRNELVGGADRIEDILQTPVRTFAWPWGRRKNLTEVAMTIVRQRYEVAFSTEAGATIGEPTDRHFVRRDGIDKSMSARQVRGMLAGGLDRARATPPVR